MKLIIPALLALALFGCGKSSPPGGGTETAQTAQNEAVITLEELQNKKVNGNWVCIEEPSVGMAG